MPSVLSSRCCPAPGLPRAHCWPLQAPCIRQTCSATCSQHLSCSTQARHHHAWLGSNGKPMHMLMHRSFCGRQRATAGPGALKSCSCPDPKSAIPVPHSAGSCARNCPGRLIGTALHLAGPAEEEGGQARPQCAILQIPHHLHPVAGNAQGRCAGLRLAPTTPPPSSVAPC